MGAVTTVIDRTDTSGNRRTFDVTCTPTGTYATGGDTFPLGLVGLKEVTEIVALPGTHGLSFVLGGTKAAPKILCYDANATEVVAATSLVGRVYKLRVYGA